MVSAATSRSASARARSTVRAASACPWARCWSTSTCAWDSRAAASFSARERATIAEVLRERDEGVIQVLCELPVVVMLLGAGLLTLLAVDRTAERSEAKRLLLLAGSGALVGLAYLTRPEALMPGAVVGLVPSPQAGVNATSVTADGNVMFGGPLAIPQFASYRQRGFDARATGPAAYLCEFI